MGRDMFWKKSLRGVTMLSQINSSSKRVSIFFCRLIEVISGFRPVLRKNFQVLQVVGGEENREKEVFY